MTLPMVLPVALVELTNSKFRRLRQSFCNDPSWLLEKKYDGFRCLVWYDGQTLKLITKEGKEHIVGRDLRSLLLQQFKQRGVKEIIFDSELVGFNEAGEIDFDSIAKRARKRRLYAFDLLYLNGLDLRLRPLVERKRMLKVIVKITERMGDVLCYVPHAASLTGKLKVLTAVSQGDLEGVVLKHSYSTYGDPGLPWYKLKNNQYPGYEKRWQRFQKRK
jgi:bifunctional non-homologous end joining protein LigD